MSLEIVNQSLALYESSSRAKVNLSKSVGSWKERKESPLGLKWTNKGIKYLGVFLGNSMEFEQKLFSSILRIHVTSPILGERISANTLPQQRNNGYR